MKCGSCQDLGPKAPVPIASFRQESMEEAGRGEEEGEEEVEESPKELESEEEEIAMAIGVGGLGFSALLALGGRMSLL